MEYIKREDVKAQRDARPADCKELSTFSLPVVWMVENGVRVKLTHEVLHIVMQFECVADGRIVDRRYMDGKATQDSVDEWVSIAINKFRIQHSGGASNFVERRNPVPPMKTKTPVTVTQTASAPLASAALPAFKAAAKAATLPPPLSTTAGKLRKGMRFTVEGDTTEWETFLVTVAGAICFPGGDMTRQRVFAVDQEVQVAR